MIDYETEKYVYDVDKGDLSDIISFHSYLPYELLVEELSYWLNNNEKEIKILDTNVTFGRLPRIQTDEEDESLYPRTVAFELFVEFNLDGERILIPYMSNLSPAEIKNKILNWII